MRVVNETGEVSCDGCTMGEVQLRGPWVAASYYNLPEEKDEWTSDGWFRTGDVGTVDSEGISQDRRPDQGPGSSLAANGSVRWIWKMRWQRTRTSREAAVIAAKHPKWDERPVAVVVLKQGASVTAEELRAFLEPRFAKFWLPDEFVFTSQIPLTAAGKFEKSTLRQQYGGLLIDQPRSQEP